MSGIFSNILKSQKSHLYQWKPENNDPVLLKVAILAYCYLRVARMEIVCNLS